MRRPSSLPTGTSGPDRRPRPPHPTRSIGWALLRTARNANAVTNQVLTDVARGAGPRCHLHDCAVEVTPMDR